MYPTQRGEGTAIRRLAIFSVGFCLAALVWGWVQPQNGVPVLAVMALLWAGAAVRVRRHTTRRMRTACWLLAGLFLGGSWTAGYLALSVWPAQALDDRTVILSGTVADFPTETEYGESWVTLYAEGIGLFPVSVQLYVDEQGEGLRPGDRVSTIAHCTFNGADPLGSYERYLAGRGMLLTGESYGRLEVDRSETISPVHWPALWGQALGEKLEEIFPSGTAGLVKALVTGDRTDLGEEWTQPLNRAGLSHVVAVSGMHMAFLAGMVSLLLGVSRRLTAVVVVVLAVAFAALTGGAPSVVRAAVMIILLQLAPLVGRERDDLTALAAALLVLLLANPLSAWDVGLQLSFAAVAGLILFGNSVRSGLLSPLPDGIACLAPVEWVASGLAATLAASLFTVPLTALWFGTVPLAAPVSNLLCLWAVALLFGGGLILGTAAFLLPQAVALAAEPVSLLGDWLFWAVNWAADLPFATVTAQTIYIRAWLVLLYVLILAVLLTREWRMVLPVCAGLTTLCAALLLNSWSFWFGPGTLTLLDVGQGQCAVIRIGELVCVVDCGGSGGENAGDTAADYLEDRGVSRIDLLILTHCHDDHANGVARLLERVEVGELYLPKTHQAQALEEMVTAAAGEKGVPVRWVSAAVSITTGQGEALYLYPPVGEGDPNEECLSCLISWADFNALLTGDMDSGAEQALLADVTLPKLDVLVVGHHGSSGSTSQELLNATTPEYGLISVGRGNRYGHPAQETLERLTDSGVKVYRTDWYGGITVHGPG